MTTRSQKRKAVEELVSTEIETPVPEISLSENPVAGTSKSPRVISENLENIKSALRKEIMTDLTKILTENQKEMLKLIAPVTNKQTLVRASEETDSDPENIPENATSTPIKTKSTATTNRITPVNSRNIPLNVILNFLKVERRNRHNTSQQFFSDLFLVLKNVNIHINPYANVVLENFVQIKQTFFRGCFREMHKL